ncbi:MAG: hypothetical protein UEP57_10410 [Oscillospiraceae bacterium]|nr:hypothetical protein [Oscillospiraceae bacterium]
MALTEQEAAADLVRRLREVFGDNVRIVSSPAAEYEGFTYVKLYAKNACKANMLKLLKARVGAEKVVTFGSIPGEYDVYVHDDGGNSAVKAFKRLYEGRMG